VTTETYTPIRGYETLYEITESGQIRSWSFGTTRRRSKPRALKWRINPYGYATVALADGPRPVWNVSVHRLVALTFLPNPNNLAQVNHKDSNKLNNHVSNLEWVSQADNLKHSWRVGTHVSPRGERAHHAKLNSEQITEIQKRFAAGHKGSAIATDFGITATHAYRIRDNLHWKPESPRPRL
jgi:hypothetical protein